MSQLVCKKCNSSIVAKDITPYGKHRNFICPLCGTPINTHQQTNFFISLGVVLFLWFVKSIFTQLTQVGLGWLQENTISLFVILIFSSALGYSVYRNSKLVVEANLPVPRGWLILGIIFTVVIIRELLVITFGV